VSIISFHTYQYLTGPFSREKVHVAIKICRSDRETRETAAAEVHVLKETMWHGRTQDNIVRLVDDFYHPAKRPSRLDHACLVFEVLGPNLLTFLEAHIRNVKNQEGGALPGQAGGLPLNLVKEFAKQMLAGTAYLHDFCRHIHTDLKVRCFPYFVHSSNSPNVVAGEFRSNFPRH